MRVVLLVIAALALPAPALAQDPLYEPAPAQDPGPAATTDDGRSELLLGLALVAAVGAGALGAAAWRARPPEPAAEEPAAVEEVWRPRVKSELPPLPAFRSGPRPPSR